jgi:hypothetical protein
VQFNITDAGIHSLIPVAQYVRIRYVNGAVGQTTMVLQTIFNPVARIAQPTSRLAQTLDDFSDVLNVRSAVVGKDPAGLYQNVGIDSQGSLFVDIESPRSAFGEVQVAEPVPFAQLKFTNGIVPDVMQTEVAEAATITQADGLAVVGTGATAGGVARLSSKRIMRYGPGQGVEIRFTFLFTTGVASTTQAAGVGDAEDALAFAMNGTSLAVLRRTGGQVEIRTLTITAPAGGAGNVTVTLNAGAGVVVALAGTESIGEVAQEIANADFSAEGGGWHVVYGGNKVVFYSIVAESRAGAYTYAAGATGTTGAFTQDIAGSAATEVFVDQASWNRDVADGTDVLPGIDVTKGQVARISYQWLGFGDIIYELENPSTGRFEEVHFVGYANANTVPSLRQPDAALMLEADNKATTNDLVVKSGSMGAFSMGQPVRWGPGHSVSATGNTGTTRLAILAIRIKALNLAGVTNKINVFIQSLSFGNGGGKPAEFRLYHNPTLVGAPVWTDVESTNSTLEQATAMTSLTGGDRLETFLVAAGGGEPILFPKGQELVLRPGDIIAVDGALASGAASDLLVAMKFVEDI